ncbi:apolipoprotein B [Caldicellulosiruptor kronotskyensis 2002]|uniref:Apolipoprotein B n=1 Tax=Caldicellulosiruptor kronotskyensis (strain DSM 18902 / VKM B-2412 / 2002) TaxID=632348 RepID=E4SH26_CALK2|nr:apolipoprotein B [Caldicellulosiruptor kronotskyensis 2002]
MMIEVLQEGLNIDLFNHLVIIKNILLKYIPSGVKIKLLKSSKGV